MECVFTIVAKNYIGLALILKQSYLKYNNTPFFIMVADEIDGVFSNAEVIEAKKVLDIEEEKWYELAMKYDLTEFCTSIKPHCFKYFFKNYSKVVYLDPDILLFDSLSKVFNLLDEYDMVLTPHISECHVNYTGDLKENQLLGSGVFNLGFCGVRYSPNSDTIINWWSDRLMSMCFADPYEHLFTDQHWMDMMPCFLGDKLFILRDLGYNVAPWNFFEREVCCGSDENFFVFSREHNREEKFPLIFVHYSGYDYKSIISGECIQRNIKNMPLYRDIALLIDAYKAILLKNSDLFTKYINLKYTYNYFLDSQSTPIYPFHRRLYNGLIKEGEIFSAPFTAEVNSFFYKLRKSKLLPKTHTSVDKETIYSLKGFKRKKYISDSFFKLLLSVFGYSKYVLLIKAMRIYSRNEIHTFLLKNRR